MYIGTQIKRAREKTNLTQDELSKRLNVSRTTISNWENDRNYPDLQLIVAISKELNIPLEKLLSDENKVTEEIAKDTTLREKLSKRIKKLYIVIAAFVLLFAFLIYDNNGKNLASAQDIAMVTLEDTTLHVKTNLPLYRSMSGYFADLDGDTVEINLHSKYSLTHEEEIEIELEDFYEREPEINKIVFISGDKKLKEVDVSK